MSDKTLSDRESAARRAAPTLTTGTPPPAGRRVIRRDPVARGREGGVRAPPSAAKRGGKPWTMTPEELRAAIEALAGGNHTRFARVCGVHDRTVRAWLAGKPAVPKGVQVLVAALRRLEEGAREDLVRDAGAIE